MATGSALSVAGPPVRRARRELAAASVGSLVEAYDWTIYGILAPYFAAQLFPGSSSSAQLLAAYLGFALGFLVRPIGSVLIGRISDTRGRRFALALSVGVVAAASLLLAVVPVYASIGLAAPLLVVLARLVQGLSVGGEVPSAAAYVTETAPVGRRYTYSAVSYAGVVLGSALSLAVLAVLLAFYGPEGITAGGWRVAFLFGALLGLAAVWIRTRAAESSVFTRELAGRADRPAVLATLRARARQLLVVFTVTVGMTTVFYFCTVHFPVYVETIGVAPKSHATNALLAGMAVLLAAMMAAGALADRFGPLPVLRCGFTGLAVLTVPLLAGLAAGRVPVVVVVVVLLGLLGLPLAVSNVFAGSLFPPAVRALAVGLPVALAISTLGGTFPALAELLASTGRVTWIPWWLAGTSVLALLASFAVRNPHDPPRGA